jgi:hypothetical protein
MPYTDHFRLTDDLITHLDPIVAGLADPFIQSRYTGFLAISSVTVLELAMKSIFCNFAENKHKVLGNFCANYFSRVNGKIGFKIIEEEYTRKFGDKYSTRFTKQLDSLDITELAVRGYSIKSAYGNLITWRNCFAHQGFLPANASYGEVKQGYECGKTIMSCLAGCMVR